MQASEATLDRLPKGMRQAVEEVLKPGEQLLAIWNTRGYGANALICAADRALIAKRPLLRWTVGVYPYAEIESVEMLDSRPGATQVELNLRGAEAADRPPIYADFPDAYYQESRRLVASNTVMFRSRRRAREAAEYLQGLVAERGRQ